MKKTYINPVLMVFKLAISKPVMLTTSTENLNGEAEPGTEGMSRSYELFE